MAPRRGALSQVGTRPLRCQMASGRGGTSVCSGIDPAFRESRARVGRPLDGSALCSSTENLSTVNPERCKPQHGEKSVFAQCGRVLAVVAGSGDSLAYVLAHVRRAGGGGGGGGGGRCKRKGARHVP